MSILCSFVLVSVLSQTFAQNLFQANQRLNILQPNRAATPSNSPIFSPSSNIYGQLAETSLNSPFLSKFAAYNLEVSKEDGIYPRLFDVNFSPDDVRENFYNEAIYFCLANGLYEVGNLPQQLADAVVQAFPHLTPLEYFKVTSNTLEAILQHAGIGTEGNYQVLVRLNDNALRGVMDLMKVNNAPSALHAIMRGATRFIASLGLSTPDNIRFAIEAYTDQFLKVPSTGGFQ